MKPVFTGNNDIRYGVSYLYAWPAGIIDDPRINNAVSKVHDAYRINQYRRYRNFEAHDLGGIMVNSSGAHHEPRAIAWATKTLEKGVRYRKMKIQRKLGRQTLVKVLHHRGIPSNILRKIYAHAS
jgi:hypothetical protein